MDYGVVFDMLKLLVGLYIIYVIFRFVVNTSVEIIANHWIDIFIVSSGVALAFYLSSFWPFVAAAFVSFCKCAVSIFFAFKKEKSHRAELKIAENRARLIAQAETGGEVSAINIARMFLEGSSMVQQDEDEGIRLLLRVAETGSAAAQREIIELFANGRGTPDTYADAVRRFRLMAVDWPAEELDHLAARFQLGIGVPVDMSESNRWYRLAREVLREQSESGEAEAAASLAQYLYLGRGGAEDEIEALHWALVAARSGRKDAQELAGKLYCRSKTVPKNYAEAVYWFRRASDQGDQQSKAYLVLLHDAGLGNPENYKKEAEIYRRELEVGLISGQPSNSWWFTLVEGYDGNWFDNPDQEKAMFWLQLASRAGEAYASKKLGDRYVEGMGVSKDLKEALAYYDTAVEQGNTEAQEKITKIEGELQRNSVFKTMRQGNTR